MTAANLLIETSPIVEFKEYNSCLSEEIIKKAEAELHETEEVREKAISELRQWLNVRHVLAIAGRDDLLLVWFLRSAKYDVRNTKRRIENYFTFRRKVPEWFNNRDPTLPHLSKLLSLGCYIPLNGYDKKGSSVVLVRCCVHNPREADQNDVFKVGNMLQELANKKDEQTSVCGVVAIFDLKGASLGHAMAMTPSIIKKAVTSWQDCVPVRIKGLHFINTPFNVHVVLNIFKKFMKEKLRNRIHIHGSDLKALRDLVPVNILPDEYGGTAGPVQNLVDHWEKEAIKARDWYISEDKQLFPDTEE